MRRKDREREKWIERVRNHIKRELKIEKQERKTFIRSEAVTLSQMIRLTKDKKQESCRFGIFNGVGLPKTAWDGKITAKPLMKHGLIGYV